jgi:hypothetical protein
VAPEITSYEEYEAALQDPSGNEEAIAEFEEAQFIFDPQR